MADIIKPVEKFDLKTATKATNSLRVTRKQSEGRKTLTKVKQVFSFADSTGKKIQGVLKKIETHVNDLYTRIGNINFLVPQYNPNWEEDYEGLYVIPNLIRNLSDLCKEIGHPVPSTKYYNYKKWFENETKLIAEIRKRNLKFKDPMDMTVELWKILEDTEQVIEKQVEPWIEIGKTVWKDPRFNVMYRKKRRR